MKKPDNPKSGEENTSTPKSPQTRRRSATVERLMANKRARLAQKKTTKTPETHINTQDSAETSLINSTNQNEVVLSAIKQLSNEIEESGLAFSKSLNTLKKTVENQGQIDLEILKTILSQIQSLSDRLNNTTLPNNTSQDETSGLGKTEISQDKKRIAKNTITKTPQQIREGITSRLAGVLLDINFIADRKQWEKWFDGDITDCNSFIDFLDNLRNHCLSNPEETKPLVRKFLNIRRKIKKSLPLTQSEANLIMEFRLKNLKGANFKNLYLMNGDLSGGDHRKAIFNGAHLNNANFLRSCNNDAVFDNSDLSKANMQRTKNGGASFIGATAKKTIFNHSNNQNAVFNNSKLEEAELNQCDNRGSLFIGARLTKAHINQSDNTSANFSDSNLYKIAIENSTNIKTTFTDAHATHSSLKGSDNTGADFQRADFERACFAGTKNKKAIFKKTDLWRADFRKARGKKVLWGFLQRVFGTWKV